MRLELNKNSVVLIQIFWMIVLFGLALDFGGVNIGLNEKMAAITLLFVTGFLATEISLMSLFKQKPALTSNNVGQYIVVIFLALGGIIALTGLFGMTVPTALAPFAGLIIGIEAIIALLLAFAK